MAHSTILYPEIPAGEGLRALLAIRDHMTEGDSIDIACAVKDAWVALTATFSKVWPGEPGGPIVIDSAGIEAAIVSELGNPAEVRAVCEEIVRLDAGDTVAISAVGLDWMALLMKVLPVILELLKKLFEEKK